MMPKRKARPIFFHQGYVLRHVKTLADGAELLYCDRRQSIGCNASAKRVNGEIILKTNHSGHDPDNDVATAKLTRHHIKQIASTTTCSPRKLLEDVESTLGVPLTLGGTQGSISKMIQRARQTKRTEPSSSKATTVKEEIADPSSNYEDEMDQTEDHVLPSQAPVQANIHDVLKMFVNEGDCQDGWPEASEIPDNVAFPEPDPPDDFFAKLISSVRETVREEIQSAVNTNTIAARSSGLLMRNSANDKDESTKAFLMSLKNLAAHSKFPTLSQRLDTLTELFEANILKIDVDVLLESTILLLEK
ncbi:unnamed protein product [Caenorhabditis brenneri]